MKKDFSNYLRCITNIDYTTNKTVRVYYDDKDNGFEFCRVVNEYGESVLIHGEDNVKSLVKAFWPDEVK